MRRKLFVLAVFTALLGLLGGGGEGSTSQIGNGQITLRCDSSIPAADCAYIQALFQVVYPELIRFYGRPQNTITVTVADRDFCCWYNRQSKTIELNTPLNIPSGQTNPYFDATFTHELAHAFHDTIQLAEPRPEGGFRGGWIEEGMAEAATQLVAQSLRGRRPLHFRLWDYLKHYDVYAQLGAELLMLWCPLCVHPSLPTYESSAGLFLLLTYALSSSGQLDFLARLNHQLYQEAAQGGLVFSEARFLEAVRAAAAGRRIEGLDPGEWIRRQPIAGDGPFVRGPHLGLRPSDPEDLKSLEVFAFIREARWGYEPIDWGIGNLDVTIKILSADGRAVLEKTVRTSNEPYEVFPGSGLMSTWGNATLVLSPAERQALPPGAYQIIAEATYQGQRLTARSYAVRTGLQLGPEGTRYLVGATLNAQGLPLRAGVTLSAGQLVMQQNGAFIVEVPEGVAEVTLSSGSARRIVLKPGAYARVVPFTVGPDAPLARRSHSNQASPSSKTTLAIPLAAGIRGRTTGARCATRTVSTASKQRREPAIAGAMRHLPGCSAILCWS
jgi:hypothetical protein